MSLSTSSSAHHVWTASKSLVIPPTDVLTFAFANLGQYDKNRPVSCLNTGAYKIGNADLGCPAQIFINAKNPSESVSASRAYHIVRQLVTGLKGLGIKEGDCVCLHSYNNVRILLLLKTAAAATLLLHHMLCNAADRVDLGQ